MFRKPDEKQDAIFDCTLFGFNSDINHKKKRQLKGILCKKNCFTFSRRKAATIWHTEEANRIMEFGDKNPPILYLPRVLRKAKQNEIDNCLGIIDYDSMRNIQVLKYTTIQKV